MYFEWLYIYGLIHCMIPGLPLYMGFVFIITVAATAGFLIRAFNDSKFLSILVLFWLLIQSVFAIRGFYLNAYTIPPRLIFAVAPPLVLVVLCLFLIQSNNNSRNVSAKVLTLMHVIRIPVEISLYLLFTKKLIPGVMTFEGRNFDIFSGITAVFIWYFGYHKPILPRFVLVAWNLLCLGLVLNVVITGIMAAPTIFQKIAFDQPNSAILYFPFIWLPSFVVPAVIFAHLFCLRQLFIKKPLVHEDVQVPV